ncbi:MAG: hypothetical protein ACLR1V_06700 [Coprococcus sp.]
MASDPFQTFTKRSLFGSMYGMQWKRHREQQSLKSFLRCFTISGELLFIWNWHELIRYIYDRTGYYDYVQASAGGERRKANLDLLRERAVGLCGRQLQQFV